MGSLHVIDLPLVSLDLELLDGEFGTEIIEVGAVKFRGSETLGTFSELVRPAAALSFRIEALTGLSQADLERADPPAGVLSRLSSFIGGAPVVGQSIGLDVDHLRQAGLALANPRLDTFELASLLRPGLPAYDLLSIAHHLGVLGEAPHRALPDAMLARSVFLALVDEAAKLGLDILGHVTRLTAPLDWPLKLVFAEAQRYRVRELVSSGDPAQAGAGQGPLPPLQTPILADRLALHEQRVPLDTGTLEASLRPGGALESAIAGFEERPEQRAMLAEVARAFNDGEILLVEAGTGTGKSLAYLLPALTFSVANSQRVVVSTNTINLQDQLYHKDLPDLLAATGLPARIALIKGRNNYLCLRRWLSLLRADDLSAVERMFLIRTLLWLPRTATGDRAELRLTSGEEEAWGKVAAIVEACSPLRCPFHREGTCFVARARGAAESAHLLIVNHSLLLADVITGNQVLPEYRYLIVDEAHHLEDEATAQLSRRVTEREAARRLSALFEAAGGPSGLLPDVSSLLRRPGGVGPKSEELARLIERGQGQVAAVRGGMHRLLEQLAALLHGRAKAGDGASVTLRISQGTRAQPAWSEIDVLWSEAGRDVLALQRTLTDLVGALEESRAEDDRLEAIVGELAGQAVYWDETRAHLTGVIAETRADKVAWLSLGQVGELGVNAAPLHVGDTLRDQLFGRRDAVVLTSATLTTEGSFRYLRGRLGLSEAREVVVGSPFDYRASTLVYLPSDGAEPYQPGYQRLVERVVLDVGTELRGRTLVLFTSHSQLRTTYSALRDTLDARKVILLGQRVDGSSRTRLLETFKSGQACILMGTSSFWEGIDVVGEALSCLIVARLPFAQPTDPIVEARSEQFEEPFTEYSIPQAVLRFRQGFGRLIRSKSDRGVMIVLDGRLRTRRYGRAFLESLPGCEVRLGLAAEAGVVARTWIDVSAPSGGYTPPA